jgi:hypothetical protein
VSYLFLLLLNRFKQVKKQSQHLQLSLMKELVQSFATTMDTMQKTNQAFMLETMKHLLTKVHLRRSSIMGTNGSYLSEST